MIPLYPYGGSNGGPYDITTTWEHLVSQYTGLNMLQVEDLDIIDYLVYRRDAFIWRLEQTEDGREYLKNAWRMEQTEPDRPGLRKKYGKGAQSNGGPA